MGLQAVYQRFLTSPNPLGLAENATLQYVTTLTSFKQQGPIIKHLEHQNKNVVEKKSEKVISAVEGLTSVAVIVDTSLHFLSSGGTYLPGLDTFIIDRIATLPVTHFVHFDQNGKITQIQLSWDQGDLLKQVEVIGTRGKNWPVYGGKEQIKMISAGARTAHETNPAPNLSPRGRSRNNGERSASPSKKYIKDPHTSLNLYQQEEEERRPSAPNAVAPRESHKPVQRDMSDLFAAGHEDYEPTGPGNSPKKVGKENIVAPKGAGKKDIIPSRLFGEEEAPPKERSIYKTNASRYNHFDIGDYDANDSFQHRTGNVASSDVPIRPKGGNKQTVSQWDFEDFLTPEKVKQKVRDQDVVHFSYGDNEPEQEAAAKPQPGKARGRNDSHFEFPGDTTPVNRPAAQPKPRKENNTHFDFTDEPTPAPRRIISRTEAAEKLYADPVFGDEEEERPLGNKTNNARFAHHWETNEASPDPGKATNRGQQRKEFQSHWDF